MTDFQIFLTIMLSALVTVSLRALAFVLFPGGKQPPKFVIWLGRMLPRAVMMMLVVYCLKNVSFISGKAADWAPTLLAVAFTAGLHVWKKQSVLSICGGTALYMILIHVIV